ncbi:MAG: class I SAM-dependent methyltransferase [Phycisphaerales bacterium]|nr:class I SAM-dependent methyltransferase [Phycisphaerales bacterium]
MAPTDHHRQRVKTHARSHFEKWALSYDRSRLNEVVFFPSVRRCQEEILRWKAQRPKGAFRALDVGCGTGTLLSVLEADPDAELLVGLDYAEGMARRAHEKFTAADEPERMMAVRGDSERLPFVDAAFDVVTCCNSFHHYPHQERAVAEFFRVLRPGGMLVLIDGFRDNVIGWVIFDVCVAMVEKHVHHASWSRTRSLLKEAGFADITQKKMNVLAPLLVSRAIKR